MAPLTHRAGAGVPSLVSPSTPRSKPPARCFWRQSYDLLTLLPQLPTFEMLQVSDILQLRVASCAAVDGQVLAHHLAQGAELSRRRKICDLPLQHFSTAHPELTGGMRSTSPCRAIPCCRSATGALLASFARLTCCWRGWKLQASRLKSRLAAGTAGGAVKLRTPGPGSS